MNCCYRDTCAEARARGDVVCPMEKLAELAAELAYLVEHVTGHLGADIGIDWSRRREKALKQWKEVRDA